MRIQSSIEEMVSELEAIIDEHKVTDLIVNGDVKSGIDRNLGVGVGQRSPFFL